MYKINNKIPGWNGPEILEVLAQCAAAVPPGGSILELGALFGRSTYVLGHNKHPSVKLSVIDIWSDIYLSRHIDIGICDNKHGNEERLLLSSKIKSDPDRLEAQDFYDLWQYWVGDVPNMTSFRGRTSVPNHDYPDQDLIFHDAGHEYEDLKFDLVHWFPKLKPNGIIIIDDYYPAQYPGLCQAVDEFVIQNNLETEMVTGRNILLKRKA